jgi:hypothetical protein
MREIRGKPGNSGCPSGFILLKSIHNISRLRPGNSVHAQRLTDSLFISFRFFNVFSKQPFRSHYTQPQSPPASRSLVFCLFFTQTPKPDPLPRLFPSSLFPFPFSLFPFIHSRPRQSNSTNFRNTPDPPNPPASKNSYPLSFQHFQPPPPPKPPAFSVRSRTPAPR